MTAILGARQVGKTTLALQFAETVGTPCHRFDLENPTDLARLADPMIGLGGLNGLVILDEVQRRPDLIRVLRVLADRPTAPAKFLLLGSASPELVTGSSESLAGRIAYHELRGFSLEEVGVDLGDRLWLRGGFPRAFLAESDAASAEWRRDFVRTFLERDLAQLGVRIPAETLRRFWTMVAHYHGQLWSGAELARSFGVADTTVRRYLDVLTAALGFEFKYTAAPSVTKSMHSAREDLHLKRLDVVHAGEGVFPTREGIRAVALRSVQDALAPL